MMANLYRMKQQVWPEICVYFGLKGIPPESSGEPFNAAEWMAEHQKDWSGFVAKHAIRTGALEATSMDFMQAITSIPFRRDYDASASRAIGFTEERPHAEGYKMAFDDMRRARIIP